MKFVLSLQINKHKACPDSLPIIDRSGSRGMQQWTSCKNRSKGDQINFILGLRAIQFLDPLLDLIARLQWGFCCCRFVLFFGLSNGLFYFAFIYMGAFQFSLTPNLNSFLLSSFIFHLFPLSYKVCVQRLYYHFTCNVTLFCRPDALCISC